MAPAVQPPLFSFISDQSLALLLPIVVYWVYSLFFHWISVQQFPWLERYRIHDPEEETRNRVSLREVIKAVIVQQVLQTALGFIAVVADDSDMVFDDDLSLEKYRQRISTVLALTHVSQALVTPRFLDMAAHICYFYLESLARFWVAMAFLDTWQYFLHRLFHVVPYLYKHFHSRHHRLYVTYSFGALYNHPFEGFLMDSVGASLAFLISGMGNRGALAFFSFSTLKTVDDHCGYNLPFNPLQLIFNNNADYHDIHHQTFGIKKNFSQPFGTIWDFVLNTHMSREEANLIIKAKEERKAARLAKAQSSAVSNRTSSAHAYASSDAKYLSRDDFLPSSGNNSGNNSCNDSIEGGSSDDETVTLGDSDSSGSTLAALGGASDSTDSVDASGGVTTATELARYRELLTKRGRMDNGFVSGKGQGKAAL